MFAATAFKLFQAIRKHEIPATNAHLWIVLVIGFVISFIVALGVVAWFMNWVRRRGFVPFAVYRIVVGLAILIWFYRMGGQVR